MNTLMLTVAVILLLGSAALQIILALAGNRAKRTAPNPEAHALALRKEVRTVTANVGILNTRLSDLERQLVELGQRHERLEQPVNQAYEVAVNLARKGADVEDIMSTCGLSRGEAELMGRIYQGGEGASGARRPEVAARQ